MWIKVRLLLMQPVVPRDLWDRASCVKWRPAPEGQAAIFACSSEWIEADFTMDRG